MPSSCRPLQRVRIYEHWCQLWHSCTSPGHPWRSNLPAPTGQFGSRVAGGKDASSPRYIFTRLAPLARHVFNKDDDCLLAYLNEEGLDIEPEW